MKKVIITVFVLACMLGGTSCVKQLLAKTEAKVAQLEERIAYMKEDCVPMRFEILEKKGDKMKVKTAFYDVSTDKKVGRNGTFELEGEELNVDFQILKLSEESFLFFPCGLYTNFMPMSESLKLYDLYGEDGFPDIYGSVIDGNADGEALSEKDRAALQSAISSYFTATMAGGQSEAAEQYGTAVHDLKTVSQFKTGFVYKVLCHPHTGGIEIVKAD